MTRDHPTTEQEFQPLEKPATADHPGEDPAPPQEPGEEDLQYLRWAFDYDLLMVRQKVLAIAQKYYVHDWEGRPRFFVVRPPRIRLNMMAGFGSFLVTITMLIVAFHFLFREGMVVTAIATFIVGGYLASFVRILLTPFRDIRVFTDETESVQVLFISQDNKFGFYRWFTVFDAAGHPVARLRRNSITAIWRRGWVAETLAGEPICAIREDSLLLSILRRWLGPLFGLLRTNFDFYFPDGERFGEYNRKFAIIDQYVLDLRGDPWAMVDRRVTLAMAILLDTAEGR